MTAAPAKAAAAGSFTEPLQLPLIAVAVLSAAFGDLRDAIAIATVITAAVARPVTGAQGIRIWHVGIMVVDLLSGIAAGLLLAWVALIVVLVIVRPRGGLLREALRLLPDVLRLLPRLAADRSLPRCVRVRLALLLAYLASPIDLVPDFIPVVGYADDGAPRARLEVAM